MPIPFDPKELEIIGETPGFFGIMNPIYNYPMTAREAYISLMKREPVWQMMGGETQMFSPQVNPDNAARAFIFDGSGDQTKGGIDMFGIEWEYVEQVGGSMVRPGAPFLADANEWREKLVWPDIDKWDWEGCRKANENFFRKDVYVVVWFLNGWFERLISFMDFENAAFALIDEDQQDAVKDLFMELSSLYIRIFDKYLEYFPEIDGFCIHDDWGGQKSTFFSPETAEEFIVPAMRKVTDHLHSKGKFCELHSCGQAIKQIPNFIKAGWDMWNGQPMNDTHQQYELYGDKIIIGVIPEAFDPQTTSDEEQQRLAREYADKFCKPGKPSVVNGMFGMPKAYREELYKQSRINYFAIDN